QQPGKSSGRGWTLWSTKTARNPLHGGLKRAGRRARRCRPASLRRAPGRHRRNCCWTTGNKNMTRELQGDTAIDFRLERLRRAWLKGRTPAALAVAQHFASAGLAEAQYLLGQMLSSTGAPEDAEKAKHWYRAASDQGHAAATKALWWMTANDGGEDAWERALVFAQRAAE